MQREAEEKLAAEQAARAEEDARLRELYPLPEDSEEYPSEEESPPIDSEVTTISNVENSSELKSTSTEEDGTR